MQDIPSTTPSLLTLVKNTPDLNLESVLNADDLDINNLTDTVDIVEILKSNAGLTNDTTTLPSAISTDDDVGDEPKSVIINQDIPPDHQINMLNDSGGLDTQEQHTTEAPIKQNDTVGERPKESAEVINATVDENQIPVFSEWAQKRMEEAEKKMEQDTANTSTQKRNTTSGSKTPVLKLRVKNYASPDCGAKIIAANSESTSTGSVLTSTKDEYLLSPCTSRIWFVVELCEAIQAEIIELANFELFSSSPKNFSVSVSNRFPTREWSNVGKFTAKDERFIQTFDLHPHLFGKYVRVDINSHYNSEHFCPISLFRVYGTSEFEAFETENRVHHEDDDDVDDDMVAVDDSKMPIKTANNNIFKSAQDAVMSIVKKAASFVKPNENKTNEMASIDRLPVADQKDNEICQTPNYLVSCRNCTENLLQDVSDLLSCKHNVLNNMLSVDLVKHSILKSQICANIVAVDISSGCRNQNAMVSTMDLTDIRRDYVSNVLPLSYVIAMCNILAVGQGQLRRTNLTVSSDSFSSAKLDDKFEQVVQVDELNVELHDTQSGSAIDLTATVNSVEVEAVKETVTHKIEEKLIDRTDAKPTENLEHFEFTPQSSADDVRATILRENVQMDIISNILPPVLDHGPELTKESTKETQSTADDGIDTTTTVPSNNNNNSWENVESFLAIDATTVSSDLNDVTQSSVELQNSPVTGTHQPGQKVHSESVFIRLSNRIKVCTNHRSSSFFYR